MKGTVCFLCVFAAVTAVTAATVVTNGQNEVTYDVPLGETYVERGSFSLAIAKVTKKGAGTLELVASHPDFRKRTLVIEGGFVKAARKDSPVGTSTVKVLSHAALHYTGENPGQTTPIFEAVEIEGDGPDGKGAFCRTTKGYGDQLVKKLTLTGDATIGGTTRYGVYEIDLNGYTLTNAVTSGDPLMFLQSKVLNPGNIVQRSKKVLLQGVQSWGDPDPEACTWRMGLDGTELCLWSGSLAFPWHVVAESSFKVTAGSALQVMTGPIDLNGKTVTFANANGDKERTIEVRGDIRGGQVIKTDDSLTLRLVDSDHELESYFGSWGPAVITGGVSHVLAKDSSQPVQLMNGSSLSMADAGRVDVSSAPVLVYNTSSSQAPKPSRLAVSGNTRWAQTEGTIVQVGGKRERADGHAGWGVMSVSDGAVVTNGFSVAPKGRGALYVRDGASVCSRGGFTLHVAGDYAPDAFCYGFLGVKDARFESAGSLHMGVAANAESHAVFHGGGFHHGARELVVGHSGYGNFYADGTSLSSGLSTFVVTIGARNASVGGEGVFTLDNGATARVGRLLHRAHTNFVAQVNVNNGARLGVRDIWCAENHDTGDHLGAADGARSVFSFDGGTIDFFRENESAKLFVDKPDMAVVHGGGLTINVANQSTVVVDMPLTRPAAKSFKSISLPADAAFREKRFIGPVRLVIEGPGTGATAFIDFDTETETLGESVITSKGSGYDETTKVYAVPHETPDERYECAYELQEEPGGDLVKTGPGLLYLDVPNTYGGDTIVDGGSLYARADFALPFGTSVRVNNGAVLDLLGKSARFRSIGGSGGFINGAKDGGALEVETLDLSDAGKIECNGVSKIVVTGTLKVDCRDLVANQAAGRKLTLVVNVEFAPTARIEFSHVEALDPAVAEYPILASGWGVAFVGAPALVAPESLGGRWRYRTTAKRVSLRLNRGMIATIR